MNATRPSYEQLLAACKMALACIEVQRRVSLMFQQEVPAREAIHVAAGQLAMVIEATENDMTLDKLVRWGLTELTRLQMEECDDE